MTQLASDARCRAGTVHHVSFRVDDLAASLAFYEGVLGCTRIDRPDDLGEGAWLRAGTTEVHLIVHPADEATGTPPGRTVPFANHVAFHTDDLEGAKEGFLALGYEIVPSFFGLPQFFVSDPSGNVIEFTAY